ncbi:MAG TPA: hypothetical protein VKY29_02950 [Cryomorphaceae bacterium]|nr:hypothetical protein [Cryomorphaceae bacterium]
MDEARNRVEMAFRTLESRVRSRDFAGYDPYDALTGFLPWSKMGKWPAVLAIQTGKRMPVNFRPLLGIRKAHNPKALGLFLLGYSIRPPTPEREEICNRLFERLMELRSPGTEGIAWGYPFPWASPAKYLPAFSPTGVVTGFVAQGLEAYYRAYGDERVPGVLEDICRFITADLHHTESQGFYAISYSTVEPDFCHNASLLSAQAYASAYALNGNREYAHGAERALRTVLDRQHPDGRWDYSESLATGKVRVQTDFHQGFILDSILSIAGNGVVPLQEVRGALEKGFEFYRSRQFSPRGRALWRLPKSYPADIHHQAQGIVTAARMHRAGVASALDMAVKIADYAVEHFRAPHGGYRYRIHRAFTDRTEYMRWGNAWMFLALGELLSTLDAGTKTRAYTGRGDSRKAALEA